MEEVALGIIKIIGRILFFVFVELSLDILLKGPGHLIVKLFSRNKEKEPTENQSLIVGIIFWALISVIVFLVFRYAL